ncbi:hypothetical protein [Streptomyces sp. P9-A4]|uniref:hypothetical protein n=1 Tax=Streptomyces sp. P9-A4 TaxID=3072285 RepID=UPI002FCA369C
MSNARPRAASPVPVTPPDVEGTRLRKRSMIRAGLFVPASPLAGILVLTRENTTQLGAEGVFPLLLLTAFA